VGGVPGDDISCSDIIVEDDAPDQPYDTWMEYSTWFDSSNGNGYREHHTYSWDEPDSYAYWLPVIPAQGYYQVYAFVPPISSRTTHAEYYISGITAQLVYRDQSGAALRWMSLGTFEFAAGYSFDTWVRLCDYTTEPQYSHWVAADPIKFTASLGRQLWAGPQRYGGHLSQRWGQRWLQCGQHRLLGSPLYLQRPTPGGRGARVRRRRRSGRHHAQYVRRWCHDDRFSHRQVRKGFSSFQGGSSTAYGPLVYRTYSQGGYTWDAGIAVQNLSTQSANVNLYYYNSSGTLAGQQLNQTINGRGTGVFLAPVSGFKGSVRITADRNVVAAVNVVNDAGSGDTHAIYNASSR
jgi:hypothetical protein